MRSSCVRGRGTETSAEVLVGPPWRMESNAGINYYSPPTPPTDQVIRENPASRYFSSKLSSGKMLLER